MPKVNKEGDEVQRLSWVEGVKRGRRGITILTPSPHQDRLILLPTPLRKNFSNRRVGLSLLPFCHQIWSIRPYKSRPEQLFLPSSASPLGRVEQLHSSWKRLISLSDSWRRRPLLWNWRFRLILLFCWNFCPLLLWLLIWYRKALLLLSIKVERLVSLSPLWIDSTETEYYYDYSDLSPFLSRISHLFWWLPRGGGRLKVIALG